MDTGTLIIIVISAFFLVWFVAGGLISRNIGKQYSDWLTPGLKVFNGEVKGKTLGFPVSGGRFTFTEGRGALEKGELIFILASRENLPLFISNTIQGVKDEMILRSTMKNPGGSEIEIGRSSDRRFSQMLARDPKHPFHITSNESGWIYAWRGEKNTTTYDAMIAFQKKYQSHLIRASIRKEEPHLVLRVKMDVHHSTGSGELFNDFLVATQTLNSE